MNCFYFYVACHTYAICISMKSSEVPCRSMSATNNSSTDTVHMV
jgi:hypothetical protein